MALHHLDVSNPGAPDSKAALARQPSGDRKDKVTFGDYTLALDGGVFSRLQHSSDRLDRTSVAMFKRVLQLWGDHFRKPVPLEASSDIEVSWLSEGRAALAAFSAGGEMVTISALLSGRSDVDDNRVLDYFREILAEGGRPTDLSAPHLAGIADRPVVLSIPLPASDPEVMSLVGELEVCLSAAFFEACE
jgi:hypothetical protein